VTYKKTTAVIFEKPGTLELRAASLRAPNASECLVESQWSGISTGTERLMLTGQMPPFPGLGYPLIPGYETVGKILESPKGSKLTPGTTVFAPGSVGFTDAKNLFGGSAQHLVCREDKLIALPEKLSSDGVLLALAATALHALRRCESVGPPELIVGHGVLGQLLARLTRIIHGVSPTVWERDPARRPSNLDYTVYDADQDPRYDYGVVCDVSGSADALNQMIARCKPGATAVLGGFYSSAVTFDFPPAFIREINLLVSAEWQPQDLKEAARLASDGTLDFSQLITDVLPVTHAAQAYDRAFNDSSCLKMVIDWRSI
jgi:3-hydroxyethyl bacteriochlorophyllide a dehydrogenase